MIVTAGTPASLAVKKATSVVPLVMIAGDPRKTGTGKSTPIETMALQPRVAERISFDEVAEAHRRLEAGGLEGKLVLCSGRSL